MANIPNVKLNDGQFMPQIGLGLWKVEDAQADSIITQALDAGYRSLDGAAIYRNEMGLGKAIQNSLLPREELYITTKLWNDDQAEARKAFTQSMDKLKLKYLDLYLIHWPAPRKETYVQAWKTLIELKKEGLVKSIGVSNFQVEHLKRIMDETGVVPAINQIELHPQFQQKELRDFHTQCQIQTESWSPLGQGKILENFVIKTIGKKYGKTSAQVILKWHLQNQFVVIPKSVTPSRIKENINVFDFNLDADDLAKINELDSAAGRIGPNPMTADF
ncbi:MAG: aldo/keto reductase [Moraxellaceae bacterium]|nr:aldo/keto reductase [Pseudobdellovibrionaceae bacterium]